MNFQWQVLIDKVGAKKLAEKRASKSLAKALDKIITKNGYGSQFRDKIAKTMWTWSSDVHKSFERQLKNLDKGALGKVLPDAFVKWLSDQIMGKVDATMLDITENSLLAVDSNAFANRPGIRSAAISYPEPSVPSTNSRPGTSRFGCPSTTRASRPTESSAMRWIRRVTSTLSC